MLKLMSRLLKWITAFGALIFLLIFWGEYAIEGLRTIPAWKGNTIFYSLGAIGLMGAILLYPCLARVLKSILKSETWARDISFFLVLMLVASFPYAAGFYNTHFSQKDIQVFASPVLRLYEEGGSSGRSGIPYAVFEMMGDKVDCNIDRELYHSLSEMERPEVRVEMREGGLGILSLVNISKVGD